MNGLGKPYLGYSWAWAHPPRPPARPLHGTGWIVRAIFQTATASRARVTRSSQPPTEVGDRPGSLTAPRRYGGRSDARRVTFPRAVDGNELVREVTAFVRAKSRAPRLRAGGPVGSRASRGRARGEYRARRFVRGFRNRDFHFPLLRVGATTPSLPRRAPVRDGNFPLPGRYGK